MNTKKKGPAKKNWACRECGRRMTISEAERAIDHGCKKCGGSDVDLLESITAACAHADSRPSEITTGVEVCNTCGAVFQRRERA